MHIFVDALIKLVSILQHKVKVRSHQFFFFKVAFWVKLLAPILALEYVLNKVVH